MFHFQRDEQKSGRPFGRPQGPPSQALAGAHGGDMIGF